MTRIREEEDFVVSMQETKMVLFPIHQVVVSAVKLGKQEIVLCSTSIMAGNTRSRSTTLNSNQQSAK